MDRLQKEQEGERRKVRVWAVVGVAGRRMKKGQGGGLGFGFGMWLGFAAEEEGTQKKKKAERKKEHRRRGEGSSSIFLWLIHQHTCTDTSTIYHLLKTTSKQCKLLKTEHEPHFQTLYTILLQKKLHPNSP